MFLRHKIRQTASPLRYPGGKTKALRKIVPYIPNGLRRMISPFVGGGSLEITCAKEGIDVLAFDVLDPLLSFWKETLIDPTSLAATVEKEYFPLSKERYHDLKGQCEGICDRHDQAAVFYAINRASVSGLTLRGGFSLIDTRFTPSAIEFLRNFKCPNLSVEHSDFHNTIDVYQDDFMYLDPPYKGVKSRIYGKRKATRRDDIDHQDLADLLADRNNWVLSYDNHQHIRECYAGYLAVHPKWRYGMSKDKNSNEMLIFSPDLNDWATEVAVQRGDPVEIL